ncbi:hypothetical protein cypCar_00042735 [Cyprinus carpio]|nr:hypothetical protein cypCar_00042735 [Cyprinus carpio]
MALIEGVGDEVTLLFGVVFLVLVLVLAWVSTHTIEPPEHLLSPSPGTSPSTETDREEPLPPGNTDSLPDENSESDKSEPGTEAGAAGQSPDASRAGGGEGGLLEEAGIGRDGLRHRESAGPSTQTPASAPSATQPSAEDASNDSQRNMVLRLKFLNDTERTAQVNPQDTIGYIKRCIKNFKERGSILVKEGFRASQESPAARRNRLPTEDSACGMRSATSVAELAREWQQAGVERHLALQVRQRLWKDGLVVKKGSKEATFPLPKKTASKGRIDLLQKV